MLHIHLPNKKPHRLAALTASIVLFACGGGSDTPTETVPDPVVTAAPTAAPASTPTPTPTPTPAPSPTPSPQPAPPTPAVIPCTAAPIGSSGYSLVFKGCSATNVAEYYDKTECVRDNATGLIWEGKSIGGLRDVSGLFTNFTSTTANQKQVISGGALPSVSYVTPTQAEIDASTNSIGFVKAVNATSLCGSTAWRIPNRGELFGLVKSAPPNSPTIDATWFPNTDVADYWASSMGVILSNFEAYSDTVYFVNGSTNYSYRGYYNPLRLVH
jgi:hypothetical protein